MSGAGDGTAGAAGGGTAGGAGGASRRGVLRTALAAAAAALATALGRRATARDRGSMNHRHRSATGNSRRRPWIGHT